MNENKAITKRDEDFAKWYTDVVMAAKLARYSNVKGCIIYEPNGTAIWEKIQEVMDKKFKETGHRNVQMPMLIPEIKMNLRTAFYAEKEEIKKENAIGRISAEVIAECPPGIAILLPGEIIKKEHLPYLEDYDVLEVVK